MQQVLESRARSWPPLLPQSVSHMNVVSTCTYVHSFVQSIHTHTKTQTHTNTYVCTHTIHAQTAHTHTIHAHIHTCATHTHATHSTHTVHAHTQHIHYTYCTHAHIDWHTYVSIHTQLYLAIYVHCVRTVYMYKNTCSTVHLCYGYVYRLREQNKTSTQSVRDMHAQGVPGAWTHARFINTLVYTGHLVGQSESMCMLCSTVFLPSYLSTLQSPLLLLMWWLGSPSMGECPLFVSPGRYVRT